MITRNISMTRTTRHTCCGDQVSSCLHSVTELGTGEGARLLVAAGWAVRRTGGGQRMMSEAETQVSLSE